MWKVEYRRTTAREDLRYPSDVTDEEWMQVKDLIPPPKHGGRPRDVDVRAVLSAILYVLSTNCQWMALPKAYPPKSTAHYYFLLWDWDGTLERIHNALFEKGKDRAQRDESESAALINDILGSKRQSREDRTRRAMMLTRRARVSDWSTRSASH